ncbi:hypothetical protein GUJ93_ZPchr0007g3299 [Zizania palustris]|uniref:Uncharacterized protein n=1 Tax=Zizania palustris TaxID=103762 RepID=A0A8J5TEL5_ZIZPA|nr:hypothetical protein GUJ93_ZPchr0007g3299 [Zizania palustris]
MIRRRAYASQTRRLIAGRALAPAQGTSSSFWGPRLCLDVVVACGLSPLLLLEGPPRSRIRRSVSLDTATTSSVDFNATPLNVVAPTSCPRWVPDSQ